MLGTALAFRPLTTDDLPFLVGWFNRPHVYEWWGRRAAPDGIGGAGDDAATLEEVEADYGETDEPRPERHFVIELDRRAIGLIQWYRVDAYPQYASEIEEPDAAAIDLLIGEKELTGHGLGVDVIRRFTTEIVLPDSGLRRVVGAPDVRNQRSIRAFEKAGFRWVRDAEVEDAPAPEHVMAFDCSEMEESPSLSNVCSVD